MLPNAGTHLLHSALPRQLAATAKGYTTHARPALKTSETLNIRWIVCCGLNRNAPNIAWASHANRVPCIRACAHDARRSIGVPGHWNLDYRTPEIRWTRGGRGASPPPNTAHLWHCICFALGAHVCVCSVGSCSYLWCCFGAGLVENSIFACGRPATGDGLLGIGEGARARVLAWVRALSTRTICWHALSDVDNLFISLTVEAAQTKDPNVCACLCPAPFLFFFGVWLAHSRLVCGRVGFGWMVLVSRSRDHCYLECTHILS